MAVMEYFKDGQWHETPYGEYGIPTKLSELENDTGFLTAENVNSIEYYYNSLAQATADTIYSDYTHSVEPETAKVKVVVDDTITITLLADVEETERVLFANNHNYILNMGDYNIILNGNIILVSANAKVVINCANGGIYKNTGIENISMITIGSTSQMIVNGGKYELICNDNSVAQFNNKGYLELNGVNCSVVNNYADNNSYTKCVNNNGEAYINESNIYADITSDNVRASSIGVYNTGYLEIKLSTIFADAPGGNAGEGEESATGVMNYGTAICEDTNVTGTLSGFQNGSKAYVKGGVFTGYTHGGFYLCHGAEGEAFIKDALIRCGNYTGTHTDIFESDTRPEMLGSLYIGGGSEDGNSNITAYLDNCAFGDENVPNNNTHTNKPIYDFVLRGTNGEKNNSIYISNCSFTNNKVRNDDETDTIYWGMGNDSDKIQFVTNMATLGKVYYTDELYRRVGDVEKVKGKDYNTLAELISKMETNSSEVESNVYIAEFKYWYDENAKKYTYAFNDSTFDDLEQAYSDGKYIVARVTTDYIDYMPMIRRRVTNNIIVYSFGNGTAYNPTGTCGDFSVAKLTNGNLLFTINDISANVKNIALTDFYIDEVQHTRLDTALEALANRSSSSSDKWEFIGEFTLPEDASEWIIDEYEDGTLISLKHMYFEYDFKASESTTANTKVLLGNPASESPFRTNCAFASKDWITTSGKKSSFGNGVHVMYFPCGDGHFATVALQHSSTFTPVWNIGLSSEGFSALRQCVGGIAFRSANTSTGLIGANSTVKIWGVKK